MHRVRAFAPVTIGLALLLLAVEIVHGFRIVGTPWFGGDLLYHGALIHEILRGELPPGGPYAGMPTYYPPGFHLLVAATMAVTGFDAVRANQLLTVVWLPVLPLGTFVLTRHVTGRPWVALVAATLTVFGGAYDLGAGRQWVNSLFQSGQEAYPLFPRDIVFGILPFAVFAFLRSVEPRGRQGSVLKWALLAGLLFGLAGLIQVQLLLPLPIAILVTAIVVARRDPARRVPAAAAIVAIGVVAAVLVAPWLVAQLGAIGRNGGVAIDSSDALEPARFGFWSYPREFGLLLPFGIVGAIVALILLRLDGSPALPLVLRRWRPDPVEGPLLLVVWWLVAFALGVLYRPDWPLEDALRPQRMWLLASQPLAMLAAIGLTASVEAVVGQRWGQRRLVIPVIALATLVACVPATAATAGVVRGAWARPAYAHLDLETDAVPDFAALLGDRGSAPRTILTYEDWSSLTWFLTGEKVVAVVPAGFAKLAYDPGVMTGRSQLERRADVRAAFSGDAAALGATADKYAATTAIVARRGDRLGLVDVAAAVLPPVSGATVVRGNGWDGLELAPGARIEVPIRATGHVDLDIRIIPSRIAPGHAPAIALLALRPDGTSRSLGGLAVARSQRVSTVVTASIDLAAGERLVLATSDTLTIQGIRGFVPATSVPGWRVALETGDAVVLERAP
ncbi:MAG: hypothetical protein ACJ77B_02115 [Chloroflexota bacterium]